ncbi:MAG: thiamine pyrophosphate-dependent dehydrogenase E1 component subunit alpha [bacterium]|nr:thiamine pyrophosphate-dependent dehydrogenase E1 component subunit alpha [bacterium]
MIGNIRRFDPFTDTPIRVIDEAGHWVAPFACDLDADALLTLYRDLMRSRLLDERLSTLQRQGKVSFVSSARGHEAAQVGVAHALEVGRDWVFPYYRDLPLVLAVGWPLVEAVAQQTASRLDPARGRQMPAHPGSAALNVYTPASAIASHVPPAVGSGLAQKLAGRGDVTVCSFGDGATSEGDWHAAMNLAGAQGAPVVFLCQNNGYAISVAFRHQSGSADVATKAHAYGMPGFRVDGLDVLASFYVARQAVERARDGRGPSLIEALVYRYGPHSNADDDSRYRSPDEVAAWRRRDPIARYRRFLEGRGLWDEAAERDLVDAFKLELDEAIRINEAAGRAPLGWMFDDVLAAPSLQLRKQRDALARTHDLERGVH